QLLDLSRSSVYYLPRPVSDKDLQLMRLIDEMHLEYPFAGSRMLRDMLWHKGFDVGRHHVRTLMQRMGIEALYRRPRTTKPGAGHQIYPYLLRGVSVDRPNQAWAMDITYLPMTKGFVYLAAVVDWFSRRDNVFVERLWRSVKYEEVYLHAYESVSAVKAGLSKYFDFYNHRRPHSKLDRMTPVQQYENALPLPMAA